MTATGLTVSYSLMWGSEKSHEWMSSVSVSIFQDSFVLQPLKCFFLAVLATMLSNCRVRKVFCSKQSLVESADDNRGLTSTKPNELSASRKKSVAMARRRLMIRQTLFYIFFFCSCWCPYVRKQGFFKISVRQNFGGPHGKFCGGKKING